MLSPLDRRFMRPASTTRYHGTVRIMTVDAASAPMPIAICDCACREKSTRYTFVTKPRIDGTTEATTLRSALMNSRISP